MTDAHRESRAPRARNNPTLSEIMEKVRRDPFTYTPATRALVTEIERQASEIERLTYHVGVLSARLHELDPALVEDAALNEKEPDAD